MLFKPRPPTTSPTFLLLPLSLTLAVILLYTLRTIPHQIPLTRSTHSSTTLHSPKPNITITKPEPVLYPSTIKNESCIPKHTSYPLQPPEEPHLHEQLKRYIIFHKKARACLLNPACKRIPRILVAKCSRDRGCGGLGDRMRGLLFSFTIALMTKRVLFLHQLSEPFPLKSGLAPYAIDWTLPSTVHYNDSWPHLEWHWCSEDQICEGNAPALTDFENFDNVGPGINMLTDDIIKLFGNKPVVSITSRNRNFRLSFIQQNPYLKDRYGDLAEYLLEGRVNIYRLLFQPGLSTRQMMKAVEFKDDYISVHIRTGVDAKEDKLDRFSYVSTHEEETVENVFRCIENVAKNITNIFLASDSPKTKEIFKKMAKEKGYEVHLFEKKTVHYNRIGRKIGSEPWDTLCEGFLTVFSDLFMLSRGKLLIKTGSHFSNLAGYLSKDQPAFLLQRDGKCSFVRF